MGHYDRLSETEKDRCISLTRPSLGLPVIIYIKIIIYSPLPPVGGGGGGGVLEVYMTGGSDGASYCKPKKLHKPEILDPKKIPGIKISNPKTRLQMYIVLSS